MKLVLKFIRKYLQFFWYIFIKSYISFLICLHASFFPSHFSHQPDCSLTQTQIFDNCLVRAIEKLPDVTNLIINIDTLKLFIIFSQSHLDSKSKYMIRLNTNHCILYLINYSRQESNSKTRQPDFGIWFLHTTIFYNIHIRAVRGLIRIDSNRIRIELENFGYLISKIGVSKFNYETPFFNIYTTTLIQLMTRSILTLTK